MATDAQICEVMRLLDITAEDFVSNSRVALTQLKQTARKNLRMMAKTHHPDRTQDAYRIELFKAATQVVEDIENTEYHQPPRRRRRRYSYRVTV